jgi:hypothetical protein
MAVKGPLGLGDVPRGKCKALPIKETFLAPHSVLPPAFPTSPHLTHQNIDRGNQEGRLENQVIRSGLWVWYFC